MFILFILSHCQCLIL
ncbi:hypothetical protein [uncultured Clostridium sp.]